jgi:hypothetical protein
MILNARLPLIRLSFMSAAASSTMAALALAEQTARNFSKLIGFEKRPEQEAAALKADLVDFEEKAVKPWRDRLAAIQKRHAEIDRERATIDAAKLIP